MFVYKYLHHTAAYNQSRLCSSLEGYVFTFDLFQGMLLWRRDYFVRWHFGWFRHVKISTRATQGQKTRERRGLAQSTNSTVHDIHDTWSKTFMSYRFPVGSRCNFSIMQFKRCKIRDHSLWLKESKMKKKILNHLKVSFEHWDWLP